MVRCWWPTRSRLRAFGLQRSAFCDLLLKHCCFSLTHRWCLGFPQTSQHGAEQGLRKSTKKPKLQGGSTGERLLI